MQPKSGERHEGGGAPRAPDERSPELSRPSTAGRVAWKRATRRAVLRRAGGRGAKGDGFRRGGTGVPRIL